MKQKLCLFAIHQITTSLQRTNNLNPRTRWHPALDESNQMKSTYFTIHPGNPVAIRISFHILHFPNSTGHVVLNITFISRSKTSSLTKYTQSNTWAMIEENRQLVTDEPVEVQDCRKITDHSRGFYRIYPNFIKEYRRMSTCNRSNSQTLGSQRIMPKNLTNHCTWAFNTIFVN
jgi:hypothetical protein